MLASVKSLSKAPSICLCVACHHTSSNPRRPREDVLKPSVLPRVPVTILPSETLELYHLSVQRYVPESIKV
jgi:hypothetical protein